jgi:methylenetetrahydrofolate reductase (NADPH)
VFYARRGFSHTNAPSTLPEHPAHTTNTKPNKTKQNKTKQRVRPVHWANRPKSYVCRTAGWSEFPAGLWANGAAPAAAHAYTTLAAGHPFLRRHSGSDKRREAARAAWGSELKSVADVADVFARYCRGDIKLLPWAEVDGLAPESAQIAPALAALNAAGYLTINSQPAINGAKSDDATFGWGRPGGYVYQKAYVEFFCAPDKVDALLRRLDGAPSVTYLATNAAGELRSKPSGADGGAVNAVTWGVFPGACVCVWCCCCVVLLWVCASPPHKRPVTHPNAQLTCCRCTHAHTHDTTTTGKEVEQPTVVDAASFAAWKDEAFELWVSEWGALYDEGSGSRLLLESIRDTWWLVSAVDNDYVSGDLFGTLLPAAGVNNGVAA